MRRAAQWLSRKHFQFEVITTMVEWEPYEKCMGCILHALCAENTVR